MARKTTTKGESIAAAIEAMRVNRPLQAEEICRDFLVLSPGCKDHLRLLGHALMKQYRLTEAEEHIRFALSIEPDFALLIEDLGSVLAMQNRFEEAIPWFEKAIRLEPRLPLAHKKLGQALAALGRGQEADDSFREYLDLDSDKQPVALAANHLAAGRYDDAVDVLREAVQANPNNVNAMRYLAGAYFSKKKNLEDAEALLRRATQIAPDFVAAWLLLGPVLMERNKHLDAIDAFKKSTELAPDDADAWAGLGNAYARASYPEQSSRAFARSVALNPESPGAQMGYAHILKTLGDQAGALSAYRAAIKAKPDFGEVYWSMANLKIFNFEEAEVAAMEEQLQRADLNVSAETHFRFALGKAYEDKRDYDTAWKFYDSGNNLHRSQISYDPVEFQMRQADIRSVFNKQFIDERSGNGCDAPDPIFIVGLPRSGSTLVEQILASHSQVEGTSELPIVGKIASAIGRYRTDNVQYPQSVKDLRDKDWRAYGQQFMEESSRHRETGKPFFTDKLPNNFSHIGLIHLMLPNARIINARRHPIDSCLGGYKQLFGQGQHFTYELLEIAEYYKQYHAMMAHWHAALPGKILDVHYEETVCDLESQVRRILDHCGLPFEEQCLRFYETERAIKTASSEQVRQPIYRGSLGKWRHYEKHLDIWLEELEDIINELPETVRNAGL
jgi:tetratricopeptide (TPR) repeat protein